MSITPVQDKIFVKRIKAEIKSSLILTDDVYFKNDLAEVIAVGPGAYTRKGFQKPTVKAGDIVLIGKFAGAPVKHEDDTFLQLTEYDIIGIQQEDNSFKALGDNVLFTWIDETEKEKEYTRNGLIIQRKLDEKRARWGVAYAVGPDCYQVTVGDYILPEHTHDCFGGQCDLGNGLVEMWKCKEDDIIVLSQDVTVTYGLNDECEAQSLQRAV